MINSFVVKTKNIVLSKTVLIGQGIKKCSPQFHILRWYVLSWYKIFKSCPIEQRTDRKVTTLMNAVNLAAKALPNVLSDRGREDIIPSNKMSSVSTRNIGSQQSECNSGSLYPQFEYRAPRLEKQIVCSRFHLQLYMTSPNGKLVHLPFHLDMYTKYL